jgi:hypothetical protein
MANPHYDHDIIIWENIDYTVNLGKKTADTGSYGGFDDFMPLYCSDCGYELDRDPEFESELYEAVGNL